MARDPVHWLATNFRLMSKRLELLEEAIRRPIVKTEYIVVELPSNIQKPSVDVRFPSIQKPVNRKKKMKSVDEQPSSIQQSVYQKKLVGELVSPQTHVQNSLHKKTGHISESVAPRVTFMEMPKVVNIPDKTPDDLLAALSPVEKHDKQGTPTFECVSKDDSATSAYDASYYTQSRFSTASTTASDFEPPDFPAASVHLEADAVDLSGTVDPPVDPCTVDFDLIDRIAREAADRVPYDEIVQKHLAKYMNDLERPCT